MSAKFLVTRKLGALFTLCCFIICGCVTAREPTTRASLNFSQISSPVDSLTSSNRPSPTVSPFDSVAQQFEDFVKWRRECSYKPRLCDAGKFTILGTQFSNDFVAMMREYAKNNIYARPGDGERKIFVETITKDETAMTAIVHGCVYDTVVLYMDGGIYDDKVASSLSSWTMQWQDGSWRWINYQIHKKVYFDNLCDS